MTRTLYGLPGVIDNTLVVLVRSMRKVHADWNVVNGFATRKLLDSGLTDVHSCVPELCECLHIVSFWAWGATRQRTQPQNTKNGIPIVQMIAVWRVGIFWLADGVCSDGLCIMACLAQIFCVLGRLKTRGEAREPLEARRIYVGVEAEAHRCYYRRRISRREEVEGNPLYALPWIADGIYPKRDLA
jgi:hypothetical protein